MEISNNNNGYNNNNEHNNNNNQLILQQQNEIRQLNNAFHLLLQRNIDLNYQLYAMRAFNNQLYFNSLQLFMKNKINENILEKFNNFIDNLSVEYFKFLINPSNVNKDFTCNTKENIAMITIGKEGVKLEIINTQLDDFLKSIGTKKHYEERIKQEANKMRVCVEIVKKKQKKYEKEYGIKIKEINDENLQLKYRNEELLAKISELEGEQQILKKLEDENKAFQRQNELLKQKNDELVNKEKKFENLIIGNKENQFLIDKTKTKQSEYDIDNQNQLSIKKAYENKKENKFDNTKIDNRKQVELNIVVNNKKDNSVPTYNKNYKPKTYVYNRDGSVFEVVRDANGNFSTKRYNPLKSIQNKKRLVRNGVLPRNINNAWLRQYHKNQKHGFDRF